MARSSSAPCTRRWPPPLSREREDGPRAITRRVTLRARTLIGRSFGIGSRLSPASLGCTAGTATKANPASVQDQTTTLFLQWRRSTCSPSPRSRKMRSRSWGARQPAARASTSTTSYHAPARFYLYRPVLQGSAYLTRICGLVVRGFTPACRVCAWQVDALWHADRLINTKHQTVSDKRSGARRSFPESAVLTLVRQASEGPAWALSSRTKVPSPTARRFASRGRSNPPSKGELLRRCP